MKFETLEKTAAGDALAYGEFIDFGAMEYDENCTETVSARQRALLDAIQLLKKEGNFNPPYIVMDLAALEHISLEVEGKAYEEEGEKVLSEEAKANPALKLLMPANLICDLKSISADGLGGMSVVKCNPAVPVYRWFQAANLMLAFCDQKGRVIPFPLDQDDGMTTYQMLRVNPREYVEYERVLDYSVKQRGVEEGFNLASKFSYEILSNRGIEKMTHEQVDKTLTHVMLHSNGRLRGVLLHNAGRDEIDCEELRKNHFVYY